VHAPFGIESSGQSEQVQLVRAAAVVQDQQSVRIITSRGRPVYE
jgi:hypothetical protein